MAESKNNVALATPQHVLSWLVEKFPRPRHRGGCHVHAIAAEFAVWIRGEQKCLPWKPSRLPMFCGRRLKHCWEELRERCNNIFRVLNLFSNLRSMARLKMFVFTPARYDITHIRLELALHDFVSTALGSLAHMIRCDSQLTSTPQCLFG